jgi:flagellar basal body-associated protein FliL
LQGLQVVDESNSGQATDNTVSDSANGGESSVGIIVGVIVAGVAVVAAGAIVSFFIYKKKKNSGRSGWM